MKKLAILILSVLVFTALLPGCIPYVPIPTTVKPPPTTISPTTVPIETTTASIPLNNSRITGELIAARTVEKLGLWEVDILVYSSEDINGFPDNFTRSKVGETITVLAKSPDATQFVGKEITASIALRDDISGTCFFSDDIDFPPDITPPPVVANLTAEIINGEAVLHWNASDAEDFDCYKVYMSQTSTNDITGMKFVSHIRPITNHSYAVGGIDQTVANYFAVTVVDISGNEITLVNPVVIEPISQVDLVPPVRPVYQPDEIYQIEFVWEYSGIEWEWDSEIPKQLYQELHGRDRPQCEGDYSVYVTNDKDDFLFNNFASAIRFNGEKLGFTQMETVELAVLFVQTIPYSYDIDSTGLQEYPRYPVETLVDGTGDCEDHAILLAEILTALQYEAVLLEYRGDHMAVGVADNGEFHGTFYEYNGKKFYYTETTNTGWKIGDVPEGYERAAYIWELIPKAHLHVERYRWPSFVDTMPLEVTVANDGTATAVGVRVYAFFDAGNNQCWDQDSVTIDIPPDTTRTVTIMLTRPRQSVQTRVGVRISYNNFKVDEEYSDYFILN